MTETMNDHDAYPLTAVLADGEVALLEEGETFEFEPAASTGQADAVLARYGYRHIADWTPERDGVLSAPIEPAR